jgi:hypothetical protein
VSSSLTRFGFSFYFGVLESYTNSSSIRREIHRLVGFNYKRSSFGSFGTCGVRRCSVIVREKHGESTKRKRGFFFFFFFVILILDKSENWMYWGYEF